MTLAEYYLRVAEHRIGAAIIQSELDDAVHDLADREPNLLRCHPIIGLKDKRVSAAFSQSMRNILTAPSPFCVKPPVPLHMLFAQVGV